MVDVTIRGLSEEAHRALTLRAARNGRSAEAEMHAVLEAAAPPEGPVRLGTAMAERSRRIGLTNADVAALEQVRETWASIAPFDLSPAYGTMPAAAP